MYIGRVYEKIIGDNKNIYRNKKLLIPRPEFFVLYNGSSMFPDKQILKLSESFEYVSSLGLNDKKPPALDLVVKIINISRGRNEEIIKRCKTLAGYSAFVGKVQEYEKEIQNREEAIRKAVKYCLEQNILKDFFTQNATEVINMLMTEWKWEDALAVRYEEGREEGREEGLEITARNALAEGLPIESIKRITGLDIEAIKQLDPVRF